MNSLCCNATPDSRKANVFNDHGLSCSKCGQWLDHRLKDGKLVPFKPEDYFKVAEKHVKNALGALNDRKDYPWLDRGTMLVTMTFLEMALEDIKKEYEL